MKLNRVGIVGHTPDRFKDPDYVKQLCTDIVLKIQYQYDDYNSLYFNLGGRIGADQWVGEACMKQDVKFNIFLPFPIDIQAQHWYDYQKESLVKQAEVASGLTIIGHTFDERNFQIRNEVLVQNSDFIICFWEGCLQGSTYQTIRYAVENSKLVLNALANLSLVSKEHFNFKKTNSSGV